MKPDPVVVESADVIRLGKDEMNLAEFPITLLSDRVPRGKQVIEYRDRIFDEKSGRTITRRLSISADQADGLPTAVDDDVLLALIQLTKKANGFRSREVEFSRLELIRLLDWPDSGASYRRLATSLRRWLGVKLVYENAWWDNRQQSWKTRGFHVIDNFELNDTRASGEQGVPFPSKILWNVVVFESFQAGYLKSIDYALYRDLRHPTAKRMYRFLSKRMYQRPEVVFDLHDLAFEHVGLSRSYGGNAGKIKEKLRPALEELESVGFLRPMADEERYARNGKGWRVRFAQADVPPALGGESQGSTPDPAEDPRLVEELIRRGVTRATAVDLVAGNPAAGIEAKLEVFDWLVDRRDRRVARSPAGYLVKSIQNDYATPKGFAPEAGQGRAPGEGPEACSPARSDRRVTKAEQAELRAFLDSLGPSDRDRLAEEALADADPESREAYERASHPGLKRNMLTTILEEYAREKLRAGEPPEDPKA